MRAWWLVAVLAGCGDNLPGPDAAPPDAAYPAVMPHLAQVLKSSGAVMPTVRVVPVFFPGDPLRAQLLDFLTRLGPSAAWPELVGEYGVGGLTVAPPVDLAETAPTTLDDAEIRPWLANKLSGAFPEFGPVDAATLATTIYVLFYPSSTTVTLDPFTSCDITKNATFGFHGFTPATGGGTIVYNVIPRCDPVPLPLAPDVLNFTTAALGHELVEAATNPAGGGYRLLSDDDVPFAIVNGGSAEVSDLCEHLATAGYVPPDLGYQIQRSWSNRAAAALHEPCVPVPPSFGPYFNVVPDMLDRVTITITDTVTNMSHVGEIPVVNLSVGETRTIDVRVFSDAPTEAWPIKLYGAPAIEMSLDPPTGVNGDTLKLTLRAAAVQPNSLVPTVLVPTIPGRETYWPLVVRVR